MRAQHGGRVGLISRWYTRTAAIIRSAGRLPSSMSRRQLSLRRPTLCPYPDGGR